ncbi:MAG: hypothetical protein ACSHX3_16110 [Litorimonas sp.]
MRVRLSDQIWLRAAGIIEGPEKQTKLESLVRFLARRAAEADFAEEVAATGGSDPNDFEKDL